MCVVLCVCALLLIEVERGKGGRGGERESTVCMLCCVCALLLIEYY